MSETCPYCANDLHSEQCKCGEITDHLEHEERDGYNWTTIRKVRHLDGRQYELPSDTNSAASIIGRATLIVRIEALQSEVDALQWEVTAFHAMGERVI